MDESVINSHVFNVAAGMCLTANLGAHTQLQQPCDTSNSLQSWTFASQSGQISLNTGAGCLAGRSAPPAKYNAQIIWERATGRRRDGSTAPTAPVASFPSFTSRPCIITPSCFL
jgi:hypothetical protein